ncbi:hypothetical protein DFH06DRAFT_1466431 [Mycena polygramma]|nr:hypothetical protein DFH06DRAFT_1466431 [Mycena polygramma]
MTFTNVAAQVNVDSLRLFGLAVVHAEALESIFAGCSGLQEESRGRLWADLGKDYQPASYQKRWTCMNLTAGSCSPADARDSGRATVRQAAAAACNRRVPPHLRRPTLASPTTNPDASACTTSTKYPKSAATSSTSLRFLAYGNSQCFPLLPHCVCLMSTLGYLATGLVGLVHPAVDKARRRDYSSSSPFPPLFLPGRKVPRSVGASSLPTVSSSVQPLESQAVFALTSSHGVKVHGKRLQFYGLLMRFGALRCLELDVSAWMPPPSLPSAFRALAAELRLYCPAVDTVVFVHEFDRTVVSTTATGVLQLDEDASAELLWREI